MHKAKLFFVGGAFLILTSTRRVGAEPFDEAKGVMFNAPLVLAAKKEIVPSPRELAVNEAIIALSKASGVNLLADATQIPAGLRVAPFPASDLARNQKWTPWFSSVSGDMALAAQLAELPYDETTVLFWKRPDAIETARALLAANKFHTQGLPDEFGLSRALDDFHKNSTGWENPLTHAMESVDAPDVAVREIRVGDVPPSTREPLLSLLRYAVLRPDLKREALLSDAFWKNARVLVAPKRDNQTQEMVPALYISGSDENGQPTPFLSVYGLRPVGESETDAPWATEVYPSVPIGVDAPLPPVAEEVAAPAVLGLTSTELEAQTPLQAPVSLEVKRAALADVLSQIAKQSGVSLSKATDVPAIVVTARVQAMPLHELMGALARLSGASWQRSDKGYELQAQPLELWQKLLLQSGQGDFGAQFIPNPDVEQSVIDKIGEAQTPQGTPFSALSDDLQTQLKQQLQLNAARTMLRFCNKAFVYSSPEGILHLNYSPRLNKWSIQLLQADNHYTIAMADVRQPPPKKDGDQAPREPEVVPEPDAP